jgi:U3 small nucleolar RNA-associated protein 10
MIVGLLANKVALSPKLVNSLIRSIAEIAREDAKDLTDLQWLRLSLMALSNLVQVSLFLRKCLVIQLLLQTSYKLTCQFTFYGNESPFLL